MKQKVWTYIATAVSFLVVLAACQPTPTKEPVINRGDGVLEQAIAAAPAAPYCYEAPERWEETLEIRGQKVVIDASVELPDTEIFPVFTIRNSTFDRQQMIAMLETVYGKAAGLREGLISYDEVLEDMQSVYRGIYAGINAETGEVLWVPFEDEEEQIASFQRRLAGLDTEDVFIPLIPENLDFPFERRAIRLADDTQIYANFYHNYCYIHRYRKGGMQLEHWVLQGDAIAGERPHKLEHIRISEQEAKALGDDLIARLGRLDFALASAEKARIVDENSLQVLAEGYRLTYVPNVTGTLPCYYESFYGNHTVYLAEDEVAYAPPWRQEQINIIVSEEGVLSFVWSEPKMIADTANTNVQLLPFEQIQDGVRTLLSYGIARSPIAASEENTVLISRVVLGSTIQQIPNQGQDAFVIPTWIVFLTTEEEQRMYSSPSVLLINALDGSLVRRE